MDLSTKIADLTRVGKTTAGRLKKLGVTTAGDLLNLFPHRYEDYRDITPINQLSDGVQTTVKGMIEIVNGRRSKLKRMSLVEALVRDDTGTIKIIWFNQPYLSKQILRGEEYYFSGKIKTEYGQHTLINPSFERVGLPTRNTARILPVYPLTEGLTQKQIRFLVSQALPAAREYEEMLPDTLLKKYRFPYIKDAYKYIHAPLSIEDYEIAHNRFVFTELFLFQLISQRMKHRTSNETAFQIPIETSEVKKFIESLPFTLTKSQKIAAWEIINDMARPIPMSRMLIGDVGSGKTLVAAIALLHASINKNQAVLLAPTEILAEQHYSTFKKIFAGTPLRLGLYTRSQHRCITLDIADQVDTDMVSKKTLIEKIKKQDVDIIIGTHAILQEEIKFKQLALVIVDEQHRFGVEQRGGLLKKQKKVPHFLSMTATPIPRSLALSLYGHVSISILNELPPGRVPIDTALFPPTHHNEAHEKIREEIKKGRQVFVICPLIDESDTLGVQSVTETYKKLSDDIFPNYSIAALHGKLKPKEKNEIMERFTRNEINILVSTSVIEVGIDIPNATIMTILGAERFGLAQLHQFRGRVGRGEHPSYCFLLPSMFTHQSDSRLRMLCTTRDGFKLAEYDLKNRGMGDLYGLRQSGMDELLSYASFDDIQLVEKAHHDAEIIVDEDPELKNFPILKKVVEEKEKHIHLE